MCDAPWQQDTAQCVVTFRFHGMSSPRGAQNNKLGRNSAASWDDFFHDFLIRQPLGWFRDRQRQEMFVGSLYSQCRSNHWVWHSERSGKWIASDTDPIKPLPQTSIYASLGIKDTSTSQIKDNLVALEKQGSPELMVALRDKIGTININFLEVCSKQHRTVNKFVSKQSIHYFS